MSGRYWPHLKTLILLIYNSGDLRDPDEFSELDGMQEVAGRRFNVEVALASTSRLPADAGLRTGDRIPTAPNGRQQSRQRPSRDHTKEATVVPSEYDRADAGRHQGRRGRFGLKACEIS